MTHCNHSNGNSSDCSSSSSSSSSTSSSTALNAKNSNSSHLNQQLASPNGQSSSSSSSSSSSHNNNNTNNNCCSSKVTHSSSSSDATTVATMLQIQDPEKPSHYTYLKGFRVEQCSLFLQHKCTQHRPYTCFYWHFKNQRRRRPLRKRDGFFNYNPDTYCDKYDEQSGVCPNSDECPFVHRNAGDTEKRYHLRYYKTATCIHETDAKGNCTKNGVHCAFAHGAADMRPPVYDIRELQLQQQQGQNPLGAISASASTLQHQQSTSSNPSTPNLILSSSNSISHNTFVNILSGNSSHTNNASMEITSANANSQQQNSPGFNSCASDLMNEKTLNLSTTLEKERLLNEDPKWNETSYVLTNYKTEQCRRPPRLCRQGFACPQFHNARDKRRNPSLFKYRSTPCPNVKQGDDWLEPTVCENGDLCKYCHSRTEQQFHPEIYKSSKCNDMISTGYCPRGPFCAFAHIEQEMKNQRAHSNSESSNSDYTLENFISNVLPNSSKETDHDQFSGDTPNYGQSNDDYYNYEESSSSTTNSHTIQNGSSGGNKKSLVMISNNSPTTAAALLQQQQQMLASYNRPIGSERTGGVIGDKPKQTSKETDNTSNINNNNSQTVSTNSNTSKTSSNKTNSNSQNVSNPVTSANETSDASTSTIDKLRHDLFRQAEVSNKLETLCLQYRQWVEKLTVDVNEWKGKYIRCESEKKNLELQLFNKLSLEQSIAPLRPNFNLTGNGGDLIDGSDLTNLLSFNNNTNNSNTSNSNNNNHT